MLGIKALRISAEIPAALLFSQAVPKCSLLQLLAQLMWAPEAAVSWGGSPFPPPPLAAPERSWESKLRLEQQPHCRAELFQSQPEFPSAALLLVQTSFSNVLQFSFHRSGIALYKRYTACCDRTDQHNWDYTAETSLKTLGIIKV